MRLFLIVLHLIHRQLIEVDTTRGRERESSRRVTSWFSTTAIRRAHPEFVENVLQWTPNWATPALFRLSLSLRVLCERKNPNIWGLMDFLFPSAAFHDISIEDNRRMSLTLVPPLSSTWKIFRLFFFRKKAISRVSGLCDEQTFIE